MLERGRSIGPKSTELEQQEHETHSAYASPPSSSSPGFSPLIASEPKLPDRSPGSRLARPEATPAPLPPTRPIRSTCIWVRSIAGSTRSRTAGPLEAAGQARARPRTWCWTTSLSTMPIPRRFWWVRGFSAAPTDRSMSAMMGARRGATVADMDGQSIRALSQARPTQSICRRDPQGVYRSDDSGAHWKQISPAGSNEIHEVESIAIDPVDPIHLRRNLASSLEDHRRRRNWRNIKQGVIDDSDVFSIILDPKTPAVVYAERLLGHLQERERRAKYSASSRAFPTRRGARAC
jgi:hypothetical protein